MGDGFGKEGGKITALYKRNLEILKRRGFKVYHYFSKKEVPSGRIKECAVETEGRFPILSIEGKSVYSKKNPYKTAEKRVQAALNKVNFTPGDFYFICGFGLGYEVELLFERVPSWAKFLLYADPEIFRLALLSRDLSKILEDKRLLEVFLITSEERLIIHSQLFYKFFEGDIHIVDLGIPVESYMGLEDLVSILRRVVISRNTLIKLSPLYFENAVKNLPKFLISPGVKKLFERFEIPAIVVSGGPSLENDLEDLKRLQDRAIVIAISASAKPLIKHGIVPDFVAFLDPSYLQYELYFKDLRLPETTFCVLAPFVNHRVFESAEKLLVAETNYIGYASKLLKDFWKGKGFLDTGESVAHFALSFALKITTGPVILVGQDLAYPEKGFTHVKGAGSEKPIEITDENRNKFIWVKGNYEPLVPTNASLLSFREIFEAIARVYKNRILINATSGGAYIEGFETARLFSKRVRSLLPSGSILDVKRKIINNALEEQGDMDLSNVYLSVEEKCREYLERTRELANRLGLYSEKDNPSGFLRGILEFLKGEGDITKAVLELSGELFNFHVLYGKFRDKMIDTSGFAKYLKYVKEKLKASIRFLEDKWEECLGNLAIYAKKL